MLPIVGRLYSHKNVPFFRGRATSKTIFFFLQGVKDKLESVLLPDLSISSGSGQRLQLLRNGAGCRRKREARWTHLYEKI